MDIMHKNQNVASLGNEDLSEIENFLIPQGEYILPKYSDLLKFKSTTRSLFGHRHALYTLPTIELIEFLKSQIGPTAIEVGAGVGIIGKHLGIRCTDNFCQAKPEVQKIYQGLHQPTIKYGKHVLNRDAEWVARKWQPHTIVGSWITHKYVDANVKGNMYGPDEQVILDNCQQYIMLGHLKIHGAKPILKHKHEVITDCPWYITRSVQPEKNTIFIWKKG